MVKPNPLKPHPYPPRNLHTRPLPLLELHTRWWRSFIGGNDPLEFDYRAGHRFNAPEGEYGILYMGSDAHCVFIETFDDPACSRVSSEKLEQQWFCEVTTTRPLRLVDLTGSGLRTIGADGRLCTGTYNITRHWGVALWHHPAQVDGLYYLSRNDPSRRNLALFNRARSVLQLNSTFRLKARATLLASILNTYQLGVNEHEE
jgi:hypothetical protein